MSSTTIRWTRGKSGRTIVSCNHKINWTSQLTKLELVPQPNDADKNSKNPETIDGGGGVIGVSLKDALKKPQNVYDIESDTKKGPSLLTRFRSPPKKPLSVTDIVSPAWCELQYYFTLTRYGKKRPTMAMKRGSEVHAKLEEEIFTKVQVPVQSREDSWALQLWNLITSLRTLRETGITRELQVWGVLKGQVITGVIDELRIGTVGDEVDLKNEAELNRTITAEALLADKGRPVPPISARHNDEQLVFLTDTKTRSNRTVPRGPSLRGTVYQLMLYHALLQEFASHRTDFDIVFKRYNLDPHKSFTPTFLEQMYEVEGPRLDSSRPNEAPHTTLESQESGSSQSHSHSIETPSSSFLSRMAHLADGTPVPSVSAPSESNFRIGSQWSDVSSLSQAQSPPNTQSSIPDSSYPASLRAPPYPAPQTSTPLQPLSLFHRYNTLYSLLDLLRKEVTSTFPLGSGSISPCLHACYRDKNTSEITGRRVFIHDSELMDAYLTSEIAWWAGSRESRGVRTEESFKCGMCEFASGCDWRASLQEQDEVRRREQAFDKSGWQKGGTTSSTQRKDFSSNLYPQVEHENESETENQDAPPQSRIPGAWISETSSEARQPQNGLEIGSGRKGQPRSRSII